MRLVEHPEWITALRPVTPDDPLRVLVSGCMGGMMCGIDGTDYGMGAALGWLHALPQVRAFPFCPEDVGLGTPRTMPDIHGGDGRDVLAGRARVLDEHGADLTEGMLRGAQAMAQHARAHRVELAILTDMSAACGSQVISLGCRYDQPRGFQQGVGVATAMLLRDGVTVVSQRDHRTLGLLRARLDPTFTPDPQALDHHEGQWCVDTFGPGGFSTD